MAIITLLLAISIAIAVWFGWRHSSRKRLLPCPASISWLVEMENPLARVTRSERIIQLLDPNPGAQIADIGCGPGRVTIPLARAVGSEGEVIAMDVQAKMLTRIGEKAKQHQLSNIRLLLCDAREKILPDDSLDGAVVVMALGEIPDAPRLFPVIHAALKEDGKLLVCESVFDPHYIRKEKLVEMATAAGFVQQDCEGNFVAYTMVFDKPARLAVAKGSRTQSRVPLVTGA